MTLVHQLLSFKNYKVQVSCPDRRRATVRFAAAGIPCRFQLPARPAHRCDQLRVDQAVQPVVTRKVCGGNRTWRGGAPGGS